MTIGLVLRDKGSAVYTVSPNSSVGEIVTNFSRNNVGSLMVVDGGKRVVGVLTEKNIVRALGEHGADSLTLPVSAVMMKAKFKCYPQDTITRALEIMSRSKSRYLPVVKSGRLIGVISMSDLTATQLRDTQADNEWMLEYISGEYSIIYDPEKYSNNGE